MDETARFIWHANNKSHFDPKCFSHNEPESLKRKRGSPVLTEPADGSQQLELEEAVMDFPLHASADLRQPLLTGCRHCAYNQLDLSYVLKLQDVLLNTGASWDFARVFQIPTGWTFCQQKLKDISEASVPFVTSQKAHFRMTQKNQNICFLLYVHSGCNCSPRSTKLSLEIIFLTKIKKLTFNMYI